MQGKQSLLTLSGLLIIAMFVAACVAQPVPMAGGDGEGAMEAEKELVIVQGPNRGRWTCSGLRRR